MDAVCNSKKENPHTVGSPERGAVGISRLRGSFSKALKVVYNHKNNLSKKPVKMRVHFHRLFYSPKKYAQYSLAIMSFISFLYFSS